MLGSRSRNDPARHEEITMVRAVSRLGDRMLGRVLPKTTASADTCWTTRYGNRCCIVAGHVICGP